MTRVPEGGGLIVAECGPLSDVAGRGHGGGHPAVVDGGSDGGLGTEDTALTARLLDAGTGP